MIINDKKKCSKCQQWKKLDHFRKRKMYKDGYDCWCEKCKKSYDRKYQKRTGKSKQYYQDHKEELQKYARDAYAKLKKQVYDHYENICACCGETEEKFLTIEHKNGNGTQHRVQVGGGGERMYRWIVKNDYPPDIELLCANCNLGKYRNNGICPHKGRVR